MAINNVETINVQSGKSIIEAISLPDADCINLELEYDGEYINGWFKEDEARQLRDWLNKALGDSGGESLERGNDL